MSVEACLGCITTTLSTCCVELCSGIEELRVYWLQCRFLHFFNFYSGCGVDVRVQCGPAFSDVDGEFYAACSATNSMFRLHVNFGREPFMYAGAQPAAAPETADELTSRITAALEADRGRKQHASAWKQGNAIE